MRTPGARFGELAQRGAVALDNDDPWVGLQQFVSDVMELQGRDRGFAEVLAVGSLYGERVATCSARLRPLVVALVDKAHGAGALRADVGANDLEMLRMMLGWFIDPDQPDLWRRYAAVFFNGFAADVDAGDPPLPLQEPTDQHLQQVARSLRARR